MRGQQFATLKYYHRINSSTNGNPNFEIIFDRGDGVLIKTRSSSDSSWCYGISNTWLDHTVSYTTTKSGRIDYMALTKIEDTFADPLLNTGGNS
jgi:hypothetical protein